MKKENDKKCFLFHVKSSFCSQDISIYVLTFCHTEKNGFIRKKRFIQNLWRHNLLNRVFFTAADLWLPDAYQLKENYSDLYPPKYFTSYR